MWNRAPILVSLAVCALLACQSNPDTLMNTLEYPEGARVACRDISGSFWHGGPCLEAGGTYVAAVRDLAMAEFKMLDLTLHDYYDRSLAVPGYTGWWFDGLPRDLVFEDGGPHLYAATSAPDRLVRFTLDGQPSTAVALSAAPRSMAWVDTTQDVSFLVVALEGTPALWIYGVDDLAPVGRVELDGLPDRLVASPSPGIVAWSFLDSTRLGWLDLSDNVPHTLGVLATCVDHLDNDGDGLLDDADPDCEHPHDDEGGAAGAATSPDEAGACANGIDDDGDLLVDLDDPGCVGPNSDSEASDALLCDDASGRPICATRGARFECSDGVDNDGDGATDGDDGDCGSLFDPVEAPDPHPHMGGIAFLPDGQHLAAVDGRYGSLHLVDVSAGALIEPASTPLLQRFERTPGRSATTPLIALAAANEEPEEGADVPLYGVGMNGFVYRLRATQGDDGVQVSLVELDEEDLVEPAVGKPLLEDNDSPIEVGLTSPFAYPGFGTLEVIEVEEGPDIFYGVTPTEERVDVRAETWVLEYEGEIPESASPSGALADGALLDPLADFCELGVEVGDRLELRFPLTEPDCEALSAVAWEVAVDAVSKDRLGVDVNALVEAPVLGEDGQWQISARTAELSGRCGATGVQYRILAGGAFLAVGSVSGVLHGWTSRGGRCVPREDADPRLASRVRVAEPLQEGLELTTCPSYDDDEHFTRHPFENASFSLTMMPGCERLESERYRPRAPHRGIRWSFRTSGGIQPRWIATSGLPSDIHYIDETGMLFMTDPARSSAYSMIEGEDGASTDEVYY